MTWFRTYAGGASRLKVHSLLALFTLLLAVAIFGVATQPLGSAAPLDAELVVHYFDVGQGDATLLQGPDFTILIDAGRHDRQDVVPLLQASGVDRIDLLIGTHPHSDHIGQFDKVMESFPVGEVWFPGTLHTTRTFERAIDAILASDAAYHEPRAGETFQFGSARLEVLNPHELTQDFNGDSIALRILYGSVAFMFTGDAEAETEAEILTRGHNLVSQVLQLGHHGSRTSSTPAFLKATQPEVAIYSAATDNSYGHPHPEILTRLMDMEVPVYGTDVHGTIRVITDGAEYEVIPEKNGTLTMCGPNQVNINAAPVERLVMIRHIGPARADELIDLRPFNTLQELTRISGIGASRVDEIIDEGVACVGASAR